MKLTILQTGHVPTALEDRFEPYGLMFDHMFERTGLQFSDDIVDVFAGDALPDPEGLDAVVITGSAAGVYDDYAWMEPLRAFVRAAYAAKTPMLGVCFGHQIMADALGGEVRKSEKGWGIGRHEYRLTDKPDYLAHLGETVAIPASHQDQVITPPSEARVFMASDFTPNAGLVYANGAAISVQPHPEFDAAYARALVELRRGNPLDPAAADAARITLDAPLDNQALAKGLARFFEDEAS